MKNSKLIRGVGGLVYFETKRYLINHLAPPLSSILFWKPNKGRVRLLKPKMDEFLEKFQGGEGPFSIQKFILQVLDLYIRLFLTFSERNCNIIFRKWEGGSKTVSNFS